MPDTSSPQLSVNAMQHMRRHITALATLAETGSPVLSAYLDLRTSIDGLRSAFAMWATAARSTIPKAGRADFDDAKAEVMAVLRQEWPEEIQSVAVFARAGEHPLLMALPFQATLETHFDASLRPSIFPLVQLKDRFHRFVLVICTEDTGRIIEMTLGAVSEEILTTRPDQNERLGRQLSREHFHHRRQEDTRRFVKDQVEIITNLMARRGLNHLILAGHPRHVSSLRDHLPKHIQSRVVGSVFHAPNGRDYSPLVDQAVDTFIEAEQNESRSTVERLHEQVRRNGLAVVGIHPCREVIEAGAASELIISEELHHADREELVRMATAHDIPIEVCEGDELLQSHGGVGCLLRFRMEYLGVGEALTVA
ncbi:MAG: VLRF1 family aeRF1-type release factor [Akkermansiaceae bacterium]|nr:VLRF1 family aeRF1-type release factor [Akkermansiaceae bacterium]